MISGVNPLIYYYDRLHWCQLVIVAAKHWTISEVVYLSDLTVVDSIHFGTLNLGHFRGNGYSYYFKFASYGYELL